MNANNNCSTDCNIVNYPTARVITGVLGFFALCTIATNYAINAMFDLNVFASVIATALVTCFAVCTTSMWKSGYQVFTGQVDNAYDAACYWNTASYGFLVACAIFCSGAFFNAYAVPSATVASAVTAMVFPFIISICGYWVCKAFANACAYCVLENANVNVANWATDVNANTPVQNVTNDCTVTSAETVSS